MNKRKVLREHLNRRKTRRITRMKKDTFKALAFMLATTITMALSSPTTAKAEKFEPVSLADRK